MKTKLGLFFSGAGAVSGVMVGGLLKVADSFSENLRQGEALDVGFTDEQSKKVNKAAAKGGAIGLFSGAVAGDTVAKGVSLLKTTLKR